MKLADTFYKKKNKKNVDMNLNRFVHFKFTYNIYIALFTKEFY